MIICILQARTMRNNLVHSSNAEMDNTSAARFIGVLKEVLKNTSRDPLMIANVSVQFAFRLTTIVRKC